MLKIKRGDSPLAMISAANLSTLSLLPLFSQIIKKKPGLWKKILTEYGRLLKTKWATEKIALVKTAAPLSLEEEDVLTETLAKTFNRYLKLEVQVVPELLGGMIIKVGEKVIDRSLLSKVEKLKEHLKK